jgi:C1A family cysteine protease
MSLQKYGWRRQLPDFRDYKFKDIVGTLLPLQNVYLFGTHNTPAVYDQGQLGSCTGNGTGGAYQFQLMNETGIVSFEPSRLAIYYYARVPEGTTSTDAGATIKDAIQGVITYGVCPESVWPYDITKFADEPSAQAQAAMLKHKGLRYYNVDNTDKTLLVNALLQGHPVVFGFTVYESFESQVVADTGIVPMPGPNEQILGGHCCDIWAYNADEDYFLCRNSWGIGWGKNGYFHMPAAYLTDPNLAADFWVLRTVS